MANQYVHLAAQHGAVPERLWEMIEPRLGTLDEHEQRAVLAARAHLNMVAAHTRKAPAIRRRGVRQS